MKLYPPERCPVLPVNNEDNIVSLYIPRLGAQLCVASVDTPIETLVRTLNHLRANIGLPTCMTDVQLTVYVMGEGLHCSGAVAQFWDGEEELVRRLEFSFREGKAYAATVNPIDTDYYNSEYLTDIPDDTALPVVCETVLRALEAAELDQIEWPEL